MANQTISCGRKYMGSDKTKFKFGGNDINKKIGIVPKGTIEKV